MYIAARLDLIKKVSWMPYRVHRNIEFLGKPPFQKSAVFLNIVQKAFDPPPFYLNICPILQGVFSDIIFEHGLN